MMIQTPAQESGMGDMLRACFYGALILIAALTPPALLIFDIFSP